MSQIPNSVFTNDEAKQIGLRRQHLASLANAGEVIRLSRGVYAPKDLAAFSHPEMVVLFKKGTDCVIALESALVLHGFTTATPHAQKRLPTFSSSVAVQDSRLRLWPCGKDSASGSSP